MCNIGVWVFIKSGKGRKGFRFWLFSVWGCFWGNFIYNTKNWHKFCLVLDTWVVLLNMSYPTKPRQLNTNLNNVSKFDCGFINPNFKKYIYIFTILWRFVFKICHKYVTFNLFQVHLQVHLLLKNGGYKFLKLFLKVQMLMK